MVVNYSVDNGSSVGDYHPAVYRPRSIAHWTRPMKRPIIVALSCTIVATALGAAGAYLYKSPAPKHNPQPNNDLTAWPSDLSFGEAWQSDRFRWQVRLTNSGASELRIKSWQTSCDCQGVEPTPATIAPGAELAVTTTFDLSRLDGTFRPEGRPVVYSFRPVLESGDPVEDFVLRGTVKAFHQPVEPIDLGVRSQAATPPPPSTGELTFHFPVRGVRIVDSKFVSGRVVEVRPTSVRVQVEWPQPLPPGEGKGEVVLSAVTADGKPLPNVAIPVRVAVVDDVEVFPARISFLPSEIGKGEPEFVEVRSRTGAAVTIDGIENPTPDALTMRRETGLRVSLLPVRRATGKHVVWIRATAGGRSYRVPVEIVIG
jgi:hypothetical protein